MIEVTAGVAVARPPTEVFAYLADMANNPEWQKGMQLCRWTSDPPLRLGSTYDQVARFLGREPSCGATPPACSVAELLMRPLVSASVRRDYHRLKARLEG